MKHEIEWYDLSYNWYKKYNWEDLTEDYINNSDYLWNNIIDRTLKLDRSKTVENFEKEWKITDLYFSIRVLKDNPLFKHLANSESIEINWDPIKWWWDIYWNWKDINEWEYLKANYDFNLMSKDIEELERKWNNIQEICLHFVIEYWDPSFEYFKNWGDLTITTED